MPEDIKKIAVVGAGTMGHGLAQAFAQGGYQVSLFSRKKETLDRAMTLIKTSLDTMAEGGMLTKKQIPTVQARIKTTTSLEEAAKDADFAIETVVENRDVKKEIFKQLDACCPPRSILASNTTFLNIFDFAETSRPDKLMITHWYAPPQIIPLVDVVKGEKTSDASIKLITNVLKKMGKKPVVFNKFVSGYVISRLQIALQREVHYLLDNDYLSPEELDDATKWGLAMRMLIIGVVQRMDFGGLDLSAINLNSPYVKSQVTPVDYRPKKLFELVNEGHLGVKTGKGFYDYDGKTEAELCHERDVRLIKLLKAMEKI